MVLDVEKVVRMRTIFLVLIASAGVMHGPSHAGSVGDSVNGNLIPEPALRDYVRAERTPGFSPVTDVRDQNGTPVRED
jgi:hypothetical protein